MDSWMPIETAPTSDEIRSILIATRLYAGGVVQVSWSEMKQNFVDMDGDEYPDATHWMPMPEPPRA